MQRTRIVGVAAAAALASVFALGPATSHANNSPSQVVVEASQDFCVNPNIPCDAKSGNVANMGYVEATAVNFRHAADTTPDAGVFVCARSYVDGNGHLHNLSMRAYPGYERGWFHGRMFVNNGATEAAASATGGMYLTAYDYVQNVNVIAQGTQQTDNAKDIPTGGGIVLRMRGTMTDEDFAAGTTTTHEGVMSCSTGGPAFTGAAPFGQAPDSESVMSDTDSD